MAAHIFEVGYNTVMERGELEYGDKGAASKKMDYRCAHVLNWGQQSLFIDFHCVPITAAVCCCR